MPSTHTWGADLRPDFFELGYELFQDKETLKATFLAADIFDPESPLKDLEGKIDIIYAGSFLHLFNYQDQLRVCKRIVEILKPTKGSVVLGRQAGNLVAQERPHRTNTLQSMFQHNPESFKKMWEEVGEATGTKWRVDVEALDVGDALFNRPGTEGPRDGRAIRFSVWRE